jgi:ABC-type uncharacterized transport system permease subunit
MMPLLLRFLAIALYFAAAYMVWRRLRQGGQPTQSRSSSMFLALAAVVLHGIVLSRDMMGLEGINFGFSNMLSLVTWFVTSLLVVSAYSKPIENIGILVFPLSALSLVVDLVVPTTHHLTMQSGGLGLHIIFSILAYSLLGLATVQAIMLSIQERHLHSRRPGGFVRALPPLETMESLLFQMLTIGFALQSMSLLSGFVYLENMFAQHLAHKTVLSATAWLVFATLLWGRWRHGWRGRTAVRWTISGFATLLLAYFGSKYVLEILLDR